MSLNNSKAHLEKSGNPPLGNISDDELEKTDNYQQELAQIAMAASRVSFFEAQKANADIAR